MKNLKWVFFLSMGLILLLPLTGQAQEIAEQAPGLFQKISLWIKSNAVEMAVVFVGGVMAKHGWTLTIKAIARKGAVIMKEVGEFSADSSAFLTTLDNAIKDDGTISQNSVAELLESGKHVIAEGKDVIISIRPK